jgi:hypothetical protein
MTFNTPNVRGRTVSGSGASDQGLVECTILLEASEGKRRRAAATGISVSGIRRFRRSKEHPGRQAEQCAAIAMRSTGRIFDVGKFWLMFVAGVPFLAAAAHRSRASVSAAGSASCKEDGRA